MSERYQQPGDRVVHMTVEIMAFIPGDEETLPEFETRMQDRILDIPEMIEVATTDMHLRPA